MALYFAYTFFKETKMSDKNKDPDNSKTPARGEYLKNKKEASIYIYGKTSSKITSKQEDV